MLTFCFGLKKIQICLNYYKLELSRCNQYIIIIRCPRSLAVIYIFSFFNIVYLIKTSK